MGTWGTSLYANDFTSDIRGDYIDKLKRGKSNDDAIKELMHENHDIIGNEEEEPLFWMALADTQWNYGRLLPFVKEKALFFLSRDSESERWEESDPQKRIKWEQTKEELKQKLNSPQPPEKGITKYRLHQCTWKLGDIFAYRFNGEYSKEKGFYGQYAIFRKVSEDTWWPGHRIPVVEVFRWIGSDIPPIELLPTYGLIPSTRFPKQENFYSCEIDRFAVKLITESANKLPRENLIYLGNQVGDDLVPFRGSNYLTSYPCVGWENSKYNTKIEQFIIDLYLANIHADN